MANKNYTAPKYLNDFSKALAGEVRILLAEVGQLRDERRQLQYEIAELMSVKSKHGAGGSYDPDWQPPKALEPPPEEAPPAPEEPPPPARPAWRVVHKRPERRGRAKSRGPPGPAPAAAAPAPQRPDLPAWAQWRPNPLLAPTATPLASSSIPMPATPPPRSGLFGPPTPPPK